MTKLLIERINTENRVRLSAPTDVHNNASHSARWRPYNEVRQHTQAPMIRFTCICSQMFEAADDQAGTSFQCPTCGRLVDVPTLSELPAISSDGTYKMDEDPEVRTPEEQLEQVA